MKKASYNYLKIVEWSEKDRCYIGTSPGLFTGGVYGKDQKKIFTELCDLIEKTVKLFKTEDMPFPNRENCAQN